MPRPVLTVVSLALAMLVLASCSRGGGDGSDADDPSPASSPTGVDRRPDLDDEPSFTDGFTEAGSWPEPAVVGGGTLSLAAPPGGEDVLVAAPYQAPDGVPGLMVVAATRLTGDGRSGLFCFGPPGSGTAYVLWYDPTGQVTITRVEGGTETVVGQAPVDPMARSDEGEDTLLRLLCAETDEGISLGFTVNASPIDLTMLDAGRRLPPGRLQAGVALRGGAGGATVAVSDLAITLFRDPS